MSPLTCGELAACILALTRMSSGDVRGGGLAKCVVSAEDAAYDSPAIQSDRLVALGCGAPPPPREAVNDKDT